MTTILLIIKVICAGIAEDMRAYFRNKFGYFAAVSAYVDALAALPSDGDAELTHPWVPVEVPDEPTTDDSSQVTRPMLIVPIPAPTIQVYEVPFIAPFAPGSFYDGVYRSLLRAADGLAQK